MRDARWTTGFQEVVSMMFNRPERKKMREQQREIDKLWKRYQQLELRPCQNDAELKKKNEELALLWQEIDVLEREHTVTTHGGGKGIRHDVEYSW